MGCINITSSKIITIVYSESNLKEYKKMSEFCKDNDIGFKEAVIERLTKNHRPISTGLFVENKFFPYDYFLANREKLVEIIKITKEALEVARLCLEGKI